jgi:dephospho-CoA kinase
VLAGAAGRVIDADRLAHEVLERAETRAWIERRFGRETVAGGDVDRRRLAQAVFADPAARAELEQRVHPEVRREIALRMDAARRDAVPRVVLDVPLLLENDAANGLAALCHALIFVDADAKVREARAIACRGWKPGELARRESSQLPLEHKRSRAHFVVVNDGDLDTLRARAAQVLAHVERAALPY